MKVNINQHKPVMLRETLDIIKPKYNKTILDCTFGGGGHSRSIIDSGARLFAIDRDLKAVIRGRNFEQEYENFTIFWSLFSEMGKFFEPRSLDGVLFDFGLSSNQIHDPDFGMSFRTSGPLLMNMGKTNKTAYDFVNFAPESQIANILYEFGEERASFKIAKNIIERRKRCKISTTHELANIVAEVVSSRDIHPATRTFQAIRIYVNDELMEIESGLKIATNICKVGGVIVCISFHSLEDRIVKRFFRQISKNRELILPSRLEIAENKRARSAKLRWVRI